MVTEIDPTKSGSGTKLVIALNASVYLAKDHISTVFMQIILSAYPFPSSSHKVKMSS